jgi:hypothetical protein
MTITVNGPNGVTVSFPDGTDAETIRGVMSQATGSGASQQPAKPWVGNPMDAVKAVATGVPSGLAQMVALPYRALDYAAEKITGTGGLPDIDQMSAWQPYLNPPKPETRLGDFAQAAGQAVGGSVLPMGVTMALAARPAAAPASSAWTWPALRRVASPSKPLPMQGMVQACKRLPAWLVAWRRALVLPIGRHPVPLSGRPRRKASPGSATMKR